MSVTPESIVIVDLEATCWPPDKKIPLDETEIIEIGAVKLDPDTYEITDEFDAFVRPQIHPELSEFCRELTSISQDDVDRAEPFPEVFEQFLEWVGDPDKIMMASWGAYDEKQFRRDCSQHNLHYPFPAHRNIKREFCARHNLPPVGMKRALTALGLELEGTQHRGIDDARNIARIFRADKL